MGLISTSTTEIGCIWPTPSAIIPEFNPSMTHRVPATQRFTPAFRKADVVELAFFDQSREDADDILDCGPLVDASPLEKVDLLGPTKSCNGVLDASPYTFLSGGNGGKQSLSGSSQQIIGRRTEAFPRVPREYPRGAS